MKREDFYEKLNTELDGLELPMSEKLKNEPIRTAASEVEDAEEKKTVRVPRRRWLGIVAGTLVAATAAACVIVPFLGGEETYEKICMSVDVNPSVAVVLSEDYTVEKVISFNADGDTLLSDGTFVTSLNGLSAEEAAKRLTERAAQTGYVDLCGSVDGYTQITVSFTAEKTVNEEKLHAVQSAVTDFFKQKGVYVYVQTESSVIEGLKSVVDEWSARSVSWFESVSESETETAQSISAMYDFAKDILRDSFGQYDLYLEIKEVGLDTQEGQALAEKMYYTYDVDYRAANVLEFYAYGVNAGLYAETLRPYLNGDISENTDFVLCLSDFAAFATANGYGEEVVNGLKAIMTAVLGSIFDFATDYVVQMNDFLVNWSNELYVKHSKLFEEERGEIDDESYAAFLTQIGKK